jgi:ribA/ribD-fused uncharacterized protein
MYKNGDYKEYFDVNDMRVFGFFDQYRFLSNFHQCLVKYDGNIWPSSEHAYMVAKCKIISDEPNYLGGDGTYYNHTHHSDIVDMTCSQVKKWGQKVELRDEWEQIKIGVMFQINLDKYIRNLDIREKLLDTGDRFLIEANNWNDPFWGYDVKKKQGENNLGKILMKIRDILKNGK